MGRFIGYLSVWAGRNRRLSVAGGWLRRSRGLLLGDGNAGAAAKGLVHFSGGMEALLLGIGAGFQHDRFQLRAAVSGRRQRLAGEASLLCLLALCSRGNTGRQGQKGQRSLVHHPVEHHAQRINVRTGSVVLSVGHLRGHIAIAAGKGARGCFLGDFRNPKIPQLEDILVGYHNIFRLNIPVDDISLVAGNQRAAHLNAQVADSILAVYAAQGFFQRKQQFHTDIDIPANSVVMLDIADVIAGHGIGAVVQ